jgi:hypothetical protein
LKTSSRYYQRLQSITWQRVRRNAPQRNIVRQVGVYES